MSSSTGDGYRAQADYYTPPDLALVALEIWAQAMRAAGEDPAPLRYLEPHVGGGAWLRALYALGLGQWGRAIEVLDLDPHALGLEVPGDHVSRVAERSPVDLVQTGFLITDPICTPDVVVGNPPYGVPRPCPTCAPDPVTPGPGTVDGKPCPTCGRRGKPGRGTKGVEPLAELHVERATSLARHAVQLLRLASLETRRRALAARRYRLRHVWVLPARPAFSAVCPGCAGTGVSRRSDPCELCEGTGKRRGASGTDSAAYGVFWYDQGYDGEVPEPVGYREEYYGPWELNPASWRYTMSGLPWGHR